MDETAMRACPSYIGCSAPVCPLETVYPSKKRFRLEGETECVASQPTRLRLGQSLQYKGLFRREYNAYVGSGGLEAALDRALGKNGKVAKNEASS